MRAFLLVLACSCSTSKVTEAPREEPAPAGDESGRPRAPVALTYLGVAAWQIESGDHSIVVDPYFSRPKLDGALTSDPAAVAKSGPKGAELSGVSPAHTDHVLVAAPPARATGAAILGSDSTARVARAAGVPAERVLQIKGGEDLAFEGFSVRVLPSLHSVLPGDVLLSGAITTVPPVTFADWQEGGTFSYYVRLGGHEIFVQGTANFIEREIAGLRPDIAIVATGLREKVHDYTCRLLRALGNPPLVYTTHFDNYKGAPVDEPPSDDLTKFLAEVKACSPATRVVVPKHFDRMQL